VKERDWVLKKKSLITNERKKRHQGLSINCAGVTSVGEKGGKKGEKDPPLKKCTQHD